MQRWFFLEDPNNRAVRAGEGDAFSTTESVRSFQYTPRHWLYRVKVLDLKKDETVCVVGDLRELGQWMPEKCIPLQEEDKDIWSGIIEIPDKRKVEYRYCVCVLIESGIQVIVRSWETNLRPRVIEYSENSPTMEDEPQLYGTYDNNEHIDRGWLSKETVVQLKLCNNPITLWRPKYSSRRVYIKVTPVNLRGHSSNLPISMSEALDESLSDTQDGIESVKFAFTEVADLNAEDSTFNAQNQFGTEITKDDMLVFQSTILYPQNTAYLFDLYVYSSRSEDNDPPYHAGFSYLLPTALQSSEGHIILPVTSTKHRPLGELRVDYLVIGALPNFKCDTSISYARHWKKTRAGLDVGHRGSGSSFKAKVQNCAEVRENTIASLKNAIDHGADFVEFDVQLSKDLVPIIYHDFHVCISMKKKKDIVDQDMLEIPLKELTYEQLKMLKVYHLTEARTKNPRFFDEDFEDHQPFPTLQQVLDTLNPHVGFNIEIKWTMKLADGTYELYHPTDLNLYLDTILEVVLRCAGDRRIIFSCFNPDICQVIRLKQNKYPVMFLTVGESQVYPKYADPRCWSVKAAVQYATMIEVLGINVHTEDLLRDPSLVQLSKEADLVTFCWGDENADPGTIKLLKQLGLHGVIYDKIHEYSSKEVKESIFLLEARESQKDIIRLVAAQAENPMSPPAGTHLSQHQVEGMTNIDLVRVNLPDQMSTATSLESLESSASDYEKTDARSAAFVCIMFMSGVSAQGLSGLQIVQRTLDECNNVNDSYSCITDKVGRAIERSTDWDVPIIDGVTLIRNNEKINYRQARLLGVDRLKQAIFNFMDTHAISLKMGERSTHGRKGDGGGGFLDKKKLKKEKKYMSYAFMVLLGIFGLTGPLVMKVIGLMAAKSLLAAKAALIIVGSVALKKLFEKDHHEPIVKVHTVEHDHDDDHDRLGKLGYIGYGSGGGTMGQWYNNPYGSYYEDYYSNSVTKNNDETN